MDLTAKTPPAILAPVIGTAVEGLFSFGTIVIVILLLLVIFGHEAPPLQDYPEWMFQGWLLKELWSGNAAVQAAVHASGIPVPNSTVQILLGLLNLVLPPLLAGKVMILLYGLGGTALVLWVTQQAPKTIKGSVCLLLMMCMVLPSGFWDGYLNYQIGLLILAAFLYWTLRRDGAGVPVGMSWLVWVGGIGIVTFFCHAIIYGGVVLIVLAGAVLWRSPRRTWALAPSGALTVWYVAGTLAGAGETDGLPSIWLHGPLEAIQYKLYTAGKWGPFINFYSAPQVSTLQDLPALYWAGVGLNLAFGVAMLAVATWVVVRYRALWFDAQVATVPSAVCILGFLVIPFSVFLGVVNFGERLLGIGLVAGILALVAVGSRRAVVPLRILAMLALVGLPYLIVPACIVAPHETSGNVPNNPLAYYGEQRYYNTRPFQFIERVVFLRAPLNRSAIPRLGFETSVLLHRNR